MTKRLLGLGALLALTLTIGGCAAVQAYRQAESHMRRGNLDEAVRLYEEGLGLYERCAKRLDAAELRITQLADALQKQAKSRSS